MAAIKFSFANVGLSEDDAFNLADLLTTERNLAAHSAGRKIREQALRDPDQGEASEDVELEPDELAALLDLLDALPDEPLPEAWRNLRNELRKVASDDDVG